ncbi:MAG: menaquinone biosynthesis decarboxylase, partial [Smithellaceae bacterium]|nr:menaquinone biosynthesis decarboxylase [Smithellaceae bacterium]
MPKPGKKTGRPGRYRNLREFIATLEATGELIRITETCSPRLEISAITDLASKGEGGGKALLFEQVAGSDFPVLTNAFGSSNRIALALGTEDLPSLGRRLQGIIQHRPPQRIAEKIAFLIAAVGWSRFIPRKVKKAPCQEVVFLGDEVDLGGLPVLHTWPRDAGPFVTLPVVFTRSLASGKRNTGMYRLQIFDANSTGIHWHIHKDGAHYFHEYRKARRRMEVAVAIGTDPAVTYAATAPMPRGVDEMLLAGFIRRAPVEMVKCLTVDLDVPAEAEFVLEGYVDPDELRLEGPFGDHTGYYSLADLYPVFHVTALTHRKDPVYSATVVGRPPMEDCYLALATERIFLPLLQTIQPEIKDYLLPWEGVFHNLTLVAIEKTYPRQAWKVMQALWGSGQMSFCKTILLVDEDTDLQDRAGLLRQLLETLDFRRDLN